MNVHVVGNSTAFFQAQSLLRLSHGHFNFYSSCTMHVPVTFGVLVFLELFPFSFAVSECLIPLMIPTRCVEMYPVFGSATFCRCCIQYNHP